MERNFLELRQYSKKDISPKIKRKGRKRPLANVVQYQLPKGLVSVDYTAQVVYFGEDVKIAY